MEETVMVCKAIGMMHIAGTCRLLNNRVIMCKLICTVT